MTVEVEVEAVLADLLEQCVRFDYAAVEGPGRRGLRARLRQEGLDMIGTLAGILVAGVVTGVVLDRRRHDREKREAEARPETPLPSVAQLLAQLQSAKSCAETAAQPSPVSSSADPAPKLRETPEPAPSSAGPAPPTSTGPPAPPARPPPRCIAGIRPDGGTTLRLRAPPSGWSSEIYQLREHASPAQRATTVAGQSVLYRQRGDALEVHVPNRARLLVTSDEAILVAEARALDLGGIVPWGAEHLNWATRSTPGRGPGRGPPLPRREGLSTVAAGARGSPRRPGHDGGRLPPRAPPSEGLD